MEFCPSCGTRLIYRSRSKGQLYCPRCGYESKARLLKNKFNVVETSNPCITVLDRASQNLRTFPTVRIYCENCGETKAETWSVTSGSEGISNITFYKCVSCGRVWREID